MKVKCKKCNREWEYKGHSKYYVTCPECYNKVRLNLEVKQNDIARIEPTSWIIRFARTWNGYARVDWWGFRLNESLSFNIK